MMRCREAVEAITDDSEGALRGWRRLMYRLHLGICPSCKAHRRQVESTIGAIKALEREPPPDDARERALAAFREKKPRV